ncbi:MAG TPA: peptidase M23, partial [Pseudogracilibacillus sp.]|nr:peptidase M23 [Pseudogracilibacillus sp.]
MYQKLPLVVAIIFLSSFFTFTSVQTFAEERKNDEENIFDERMALFQKTESLTQIPWYYFAAIDNYERNIQPSTDEPEKVISIDISDEIWFGSGNKS